MCQWVKFCLYFRAIKYNTKLSFSTIVFFINMAESAYETIFYLGHVS